MKYLITMILLGDPSAFAVVEIDPNIYEVEGYIMECEPKPIKGIIRRDGSVEAVDNEGNLYLLN